LLAFGSPPRMGSTGPAVFRAVRITPADAGSTSTRSVGDREASDHPRAYGEHTSRPAVPQTTCALAASHLSASPEPHEAVLRYKLILIHYNLYSSRWQVSCVWETLPGNRDGRVASTSAGLSYPGVTVS
jgi:hypothetical protein